jgi:hypothetical protein
VVWNRHQDRGHPPAFQILVTAQQPWVAPQLPTGGDVSLYSRCKAPRTAQRRQGRGRTGNGP